jgi:hypothetical protein
LSVTRDFMASLPKDLEKKQVEIRNCMTIYHILDDFHYKFDDDDEYDKMWRVFGSPLETVHRIEKQQGFLDKEKEKFTRMLEISKKDFDQKITELENLTGAFKNYQDKSIYEEVAQ